MIFLSYLSYKGLMSFKILTLSIDLYSQLLLLIFKYSSTLSHVNGKYGFNKVFTL